jgi:hypothetical protein
MTEGRLSPNADRQEGPAAAGPVRRAYALALGGLWLVQTAVRLYLFDKADFGTGPMAMILHVALVAGLLCLLTLILSVLGIGRRWTGLRGVAAAMLVGLIHSLLTMFDIYQAIFIYVSGDPGPTWMIFFRPILALSLLDNVGVDPFVLGGLMLGLVLLHMLIYLPLGRQMLAASLRLARVRLTPGRVGIGGRALLAMVVLGAYWVASAAPRDVRRGEPILGTFGPIFQIAPAPLLASAERPRVTARPRKPAPAESRPLVLIVVDALARDRMGLYNPSLDNTPFLSRLQAQGALQKYDAYATCTFSFCGIMSILASRSWNDIGAAPETLIDRLAENSYETHLLLAGQHSGFADLINLFGGPVTTISDQPPRTQPDDASVVSALDKLPLNDPRHSFLYLHLVSPHVGAFIEPPFRATPGDTGRLGGTLLSGQKKSEYRGVYDMRVRQSDDVLRRIFAVLERRGILKDALVVITADHGQRTSEGGLLYHGGEADPPTINVPLLIYDGRAKKYPARVPASLIDVAPTLAAAAGIEPLPAWRGVALQQAISREAVPVGTSSSTGVVLDRDGVALMYLCSRRSGRETVMPMRAGSGAADADTLNVLRRLHRIVAAPVPEAVCRK